MDKVAALSAKRGDLRPPLGVESLQFLPLPKNYQISTLKYTGIQMAD